MQVRKHRALALFAGLALAACSGDKGENGAKGDKGDTGATGATGDTGAAGASGPQGQAGVDGTNGTNGVSGVPGKLSLTIDSVVTGTVNGTNTATLTFTIRPAANFCPGAVCDDTLSTAGTKTFYAGYYDAGSNSFTTAKTFSFPNNSIHFKGFTADGNGAQYTATAANPPITVETSASAFVYGYVTTAAAYPAPTSGHYLLPTMVASAAKLYGAVPYASNANVAGCEKCHGAPYSKHGYRQAKVAGLNDFVSCKVCHTDQRAGSDADWFMKADDPANYASPMTTAQKAKYAYTANLMNDVHNSHALEFNYPQSMANCVTCHAGKLDNILSDANFRPAVCKSCHVVTGPTVGVESGRAPPLLTILQNKGFAVLHSAIDFYAITSGGVDASPTTCNICHSAGSIAKTFKQLHAGYNKSIYADAAGTRYADSIKVTVGTTAYDTGAKILTVPFTISGTAANALVAPTVVASLYGYDTKDFVVSGHSSGADGKRIAEFTYGATSSNNTARVSLEPAALTAGTTSFTATVNLTDALAMATANGVAAPTRVQVNILPAIGLDQTEIVDAKEYVLTGTTTACGAVPATGCVANPNYNPAIAVTGTSVAIALTGTNPGTLIAKPYGSDIVDGTKCNACHDALGTTFHSPAYGSAGPLGCRLCHTVQNGGSHLEMQSRSIDSYVHAIHRMQHFDIQNVDLNNAVDRLRYEDFVEGNYPNFAGPLNCESCHNKGKYDVPDQTRSLPGILSGSKAFKGGTRNIPSTVPAQIAGPAERACGSCHRAKFINEDDVAGLMEFYQHATMAGISVNSSSAVDLGNVTAYVMGVLGIGPQTALTATGTVQVEGCAICHPTSGSDHQKLFNTWKSGL